MFLFLIKKSDIIRDEKILEINEDAQFNILEDIRVLKEPYETLWSLTCRFFALQDKWLASSIQFVEPESVEQDIQDMWKSSFKLTKIFKNSDQKGPLRVSLTVKHKLEKFRANLPYIQVFCNPGLKDRHWHSINKILDADIDPNDVISLKEMLEYSKTLESKLDELTEISTLASKEYSLEQALKKMKQSWENMQFNFIKYKNENLYILSSFDDIEALLDDHYVKTTAMKNSPFVSAFKMEVLEWESELVMLINFLKKQK